MTFNNIALKYGLDEREVLNQIRREKDEWYEAVSKKRKIKEKDLRNYVPATKANKVDINLIYTTIQTRMSVYYTDRMNVEWQGRKETSREIASNLTRLAEFDYDEMDLETVDFKWNFDSELFWVGIKILDGWNSETNTPIARVVSPLSWIPDPRGDFTWEDHRWAGFEAQNTLSNLRANSAYFNVNMINVETNDKQDQIRRAYTEGRSIINQGYEQVENKKYAIYNHYTIINGYKYLTTTANNWTLLIRIVRLEPITKEERANPLLVPFPICLKYIDPIEGDPFGISTPDKLRDKQAAKSKLFNLAVTKETRNTLGDDIFYDPKKIGDKKTLTTPSINPKAIPVKLREGENISSTVFRMPTEGNANGAFNATAQLQQESSLATGIDANSVWVGWGWNQTATEAQIAQKNANLRFILGTKIAKWWEARFWNLWLRSYRFNLTPRSRKVMYVTKAFGTQYFEFRKREFITNENLDLKIVSTSEKESLQGRQKADFFAISPQLLADPTTPDFSKRWIKRHMLRLSNMSDEQINIMQPKTVDELTAELDVELLNAWETPTAPQAWQDHLTFIYAFYSANDTDEKFEAIEERKALYLQEGGDAQAAALAEQGNTMGNIAASNASQQSSARIQEEIGGVQWNVNAAGI